MSYIIIYSIPIYNDINIKIVKRTFLQINRILSGSCEGLFGKKTNSCEVTITLIFNEYSFQYLSDKGTLFQVVKIEP